MLMAIKIFFLLILNHSRSGEPADAPYEYSHQFNIPGDYDYHCDPHAPGMKGKVHVIAKPPAVTYPNQDHWSGR